MSAVISPSTPARSRDRAPWLARAMRGVGLATLCVFSSMTFAQSPPTEFSLADAPAAAPYSEPAQQDAPWMPQALDEGYIPAPNFNGGHFIAEGVNDHLAISFTHDYPGRFSAVLSNGDIVTVGLSPPWNQGAQSNGFWNLGMLRYDANGHWKAWPNPGQYGHDSNYRLVYPGDANYRLQYIRDLKVWRGFIYVLVDWQTAATGLGRQDVYTLIFNEDGHYVGQLGAFGVGSSGLDHVDFYGTALVPMSADRMMIVATAWDSAGSFIAVNRQTIQHGSGAEGTLFWDTTWGVPYAESETSRWKTYTAPVYFCLAGTSPCQATAARAFKPEGFDFQDIYIAGSVQFMGDNWNGHVLKIATDDGSLKSEFGGGWVVVPFDQPDSNFDDRIYGLYVYQDNVYVALSVARKCHPGIGVANLNGSTGGYVTSFGNGGKLVFGGSGGGGTGLCTPGVNDDVPASISATSNRLGIAGHHAESLALGGTVWDPMFAVVKADTGTLLDLATHPVTGSSGQRIGDAILYSAIGNGNSFVVAGEARHASQGNRLNFLTGKFVPVSTDRIFADGFEH